MGSGGVRPHCAGRIRALCGPKLARSKMGYNGLTIRLICTFREGLDPLWRLARPPGPRRTSDRFHPARQSSLSTDNKNFAPPIFQISPNSEKRCLHGQNRDFGCSERDFGRNPAPQQSESATNRSARPFPTFPCLRGSRDHL